MKTCFADDQSAAALPDRVSEAIDVLRISRAEFLRGQKDPDQEPTAVTGTHSLARIIVEALWITCVMFRQFLSRSLGVSRDLLIAMRCLRSADPVVEPHNEKDCDAYAQAVDKPTVIDVISVDPRRRKYPNT
jgi:hypothetical protein